MKIHISLQILDWLDIRVVDTNVNYRITGRVTGEGANSRLRLNVVCIRTGNIVGTSSESI